jgi:hypothetical protein
MQPASMGKHHICTWLPGPLALFLKARPFSLSLHLTLSLQGSREHSVGVNDPGSLQGKKGRQP